MNQKKLFSTVTWCMVKVAQFGGKWKIMVEQKRVKMQFRSLKNGSKIIWWHWHPVFHKGNWWNPLILLIKLPNYAASSGTCIVSSCDIPSVSEKRQMGYIIPTNVDEGKPSQLHVSSTNILHWLYQRLFPWNSALTVKFYNP